MEGLIRELFCSIPGIVHDSSNVIDVDHTQEVDVVFWNETDGAGLRFLPALFPTECKNWSSSVGAPEIRNFVGKMHESGSSVGILIAMNGISGQNAGQPTDANRCIADGVAQGHKILVLTAADLALMTTTEDLVALLKRRLSALSFRGNQFV